MDKNNKKFTRRGLLKGLVASSVVATFGKFAVGKELVPPRSVRRKAGFEEELGKRISRAPLVDTHEHLPDEDERLRGEKIACDDWSLLFSGYIESDLISAGMKNDERTRFISRDLDPMEKWRLLAPYWPAVKNTGYALALRIAIRDL